MTSDTVKEIMLGLGADLCKIASVDRFADAPEGYHPLDVMPTCQSVISFACRLPVGVLACKSDMPYTRVRNSLTPKLDAIALDFCIAMEKHGVVCAPIPTNESEWDAKTQRWRSILSLKHAAQAAGLGTIGRHSLLITPEFGSMVWLGAVVCELALAPDPMIEPGICNQCNLCVAACPVHALAAPEIDQSACWNYAFGDHNEKKTWMITCHRCRDACPYNFGAQNALPRQPEA